MQGHPNSFLKVMSRIMFFASNVCLCCFQSPCAQVSFNDPKVKLVRNVESAEELKSGLDELDYKGGLDIEEQAFRGETF